MIFTFSKYNNNNNKIKYALTMVVGKEAAHTPSLLSVFSSTPDATT